MMRRLAAFRSWLRCLLLRRRFERDLQDELRFHLEEETDAGIVAGLGPDQARRRALSSLGAPPHRIQERCRDSRALSVVDDFVRDIAHGVRLLRRNPAISTVVLATLTLAIGATVAVFSLLDAWLLKPLPFPDPDRLVIGLAARSERPDEPAVFLMFRSYLAFKERSRSFEDVSAAFPRSYLVTGREEPVQVAGMVVSEEFFRTLGVPAELGRTLSPSDAGEAAVVVSHGFWQRQLGGSPHALGASVILNGEPHQLIGVMPREFDLRMLEQPSGYELWTLLKPGEEGYALPEGRGPVAVFARLRAGVRLEAAQREVDGIHREIESQFSESLRDFVVLLTPLQADNTRTVRATLVTLLGAVLCLLSIACLNVGSLLVTRGLARSREAAIRAAIGCGRNRLLRQFLAESLLICLAGGACGMLLAALATQAFTSWNPLGTLPVTPIRVDGRLLAFTAAVVSFVTIACGLVPALRIAASDVALLSRSGSHGRGGATPPRRAQAVLIGAQIALSLVLLSSATLLARTLARLSTEPLGFEAEDLTVASLALPTREFDSSAKRNAFVSRFAERLYALPAVGQVAAGTSPLLSSGPPASVWTGEQDSERPRRISAQEVTENFFATLAIPVLSGRSFDARDGSDSQPVAVLNERAAQALFGSPEKAVGRKIRLGTDPWREVIGVVGNTRSSFFNTLDWLENPVVYLPSSQAFRILRNPTTRSFDVHLYLRAEGPLSMEHLTTVLRDLGSTAVLTRAGTASLAIADATRQPAFRVALLGFFASASLLLAAIGVYGVVSQSVARRRPELAIRMAMGAEAKDVLRTVTREVMAAALLGTFVGAAAALGLSHALQAVLYGVRPTDAASWLWAAALLLIFTGSAALVPAIRATRVDPAETLRAD